jgi:nucleoid-associated protein YejK
LIVVSRAKMQDPAKEIEGVVRGLVEKPTLERQAAVLRKYFTEDVEFTHFYINSTGGVKDLIAIYQMAQLFVHYQSVEFQAIVYYKSANALTVRMTVYVRFLGFLPVTNLKLLTLLELEDHKTEVTLSAKTPNPNYFSSDQLLLLENS